MRIAKPVKLISNLNTSAARRFAKKIDDVNPRDVWKQQSIGAGMVLNGFFAFTIKEHKENQWSCTIKNVSKTNVLEYISYSGFRKVYHKKSNDYLIVRVENNVINEVSADIIRVQCYNEAKKHGEVNIITPDGSKFEFHWKLLDTIYLQYQDQIFNKNFLELLEEFSIPQLRDTRTESFFLFKNTIIKVCKNNIDLLPYSELIKLNRSVWKSHILDREYNEQPNQQISEFQRFIENVSNNQENRIRAFTSAIGYLLHHYNGSHMGQAVVCYDEQPTDVKNPQGGTGKGLFANAISQMREMAEIDGKHFKADDKFRFSSVEITSQVVAVDDLAKDVSFETFFSAITNGFTIEKKNLNSIKLPPEDSPKMLFSMNAIVNGNGGSHKRRMFIIEFSNFYSKHIITGSEKPIEDMHGILFDRIEWNDQHWSSFTKYMIDCVQFYLQNGLQPYELINVGKNALIQQTSEEFSEWTEQQNFEFKKFYKTKQMFEEYRNTYFGENAEFTQRSFTNMLKKYATSKNWDFKIQTDSVSKVSEFVFNSKVNSEEKAI
ncbi:hypothetical protein [Pedobacter zeae]|uniref:Uncharacterized protein n=1 Tax=Pedobacter zeae TaxID=1737356 RepID=A0A7W6KCV7_9SPHI|nr:hypothetical protein [Pedobacter zeae]MBB4108350.1 hypothetical protein [Pedobacter zeae]GGG93373.1 hypothetical protein GCM10007422_03230 [Pedobacter zeae]